MRINLFFLLFFSFIYAFQCGSALNPIRCPLNSERFISREEKCLNHLVGDVVSFYIDSDLNSDTDNQLIDFYLYNKDESNETCFYVDVSNNISSAILSQFWNIFLNDTPDSEYGYNNGIKSSEEILFGLPPTINDISEVNILFYNFNVVNIRGYFTANDQLNCDDYNCSNIIYINADTYLENNIDRGFFTLAHEYQHLLHWNSDVCEGYFNYTDPNSINYVENTYGCTPHNPWLNEGLSDLVSSILGLGQREFWPYLQNTYIGLDEWPLPDENTNSYVYYAKSALFFQYLFEYHRFIENEEIPLINLIFNDDKQGIESLEYIFNLFDINFNNVFNEWIVKNITNSYETIDEDIQITENYSLSLNNNHDISFNNQIDDFKEFAFYNYHIPEIENMFIDAVSISIDNNSYNLIDGNFGSLKSYDFSDNFILFKDLYLSIISGSRIFPTSVDINIHYKSSLPELIVYPNPLVNNSRLQFNLYDNFINNRINITIFDIIGREIETISLSKNEYIYNKNNTFILDLNKYSTGNYFVKINNLVQKLLIIK